MVEVRARNGVELAVKVVFGEDFGLDVRMLEAVVEGDVETLAEAIRLVKSYNNFSGDRVADALLDLHRRGSVAYAAFGRENSPVLYIGVPYWESQRSNRSISYSEDRRLTEEERAWIVRDIIHTLIKTEPDELWAEGITSTGWKVCNRDEYGKASRVRAWWD